MCLRSVEFSGYTAFRTDGGPTLYPSNKTSQTVDVLVAGFTFAILILSISFLVTLLGYHGKKLVYFILKVGVILFVTASIIVCNFGQSWEVANVKATTQYRAGLKVEINASIGVYLGLRSVNITLKAIPETVSFDNGKTNETIDYNERFSWDNLGFTQGRLGFGPFAGKVNQEYRQAQLRGSPYPVLWVAEYFTIDGEGIRWSRFYRQAGYYTHIVMWLAFPLWILTLILLHMDVRSGGYMSCLTGVVLITANIIYLYIRNPLDLAIPINGDSVLIFTWGWSFYLNLITGIMCVILGIIILLMDCLCYLKMATFMGIDVYKNSGEICTEKENIIIISEISPLQRMATMISPAKVVPINQNAYEVPEAIIVHKTSSKQGTNDNNTQQKYNNRKPSYRNYKQHTTVRKPPQYRHISNKAETVNIPGLILVITTGINGTTAASETWSDFDQI